MIPVNQLAAYLPHSLEFEGGGDRWTMYSIGIGGDIVVKNGLHTEVICACYVGLEYKPILRPFSTITNEEAEEYQEKVWGDTSQYVEIIINGGNAGYEGKGTWGDLARRGFRTTEFFMSKKLDVFGLIEQGLAVSEKEVPNG